MPQASLSTTHSATKSATSTHLWLCWVRNLDSGGEHLQKFWCLRVWHELKKCICYSLLDRWDCISWTPSNNFRSELLPHKRNKFSCSVQQVPTHILQICTGACRLAQGCWQHQNNALRAKESEYSWVWDWGRGLFGGWYIWVFKNKQISHRDTLDPSRLMVSTGSSMS